MSSPQKRSVSKHKKTSSILDLAVTNFGPIREGKVRIKPLTIFMGPNNSGKSYMAVLIHSILSGRGSIDAIFETVKPEHISKIRQKSSDRQSATNDITIPLNFGPIDKDICENISKNFSVKLPDLIKIGETQCSLNINTSIIKTKILLTKEDIIYDTADTCNTILKVGVRQNNEKTTYEKDGTIYMKYTEQNLNPMSVSYKINQRLFYKVIKKFSHTFYIPPSRYGIVQSQQVLTAALLNYVPYVGTTRLVIPEMPGLVKDFLGTLLQLANNNTEKNNEIAEYLETTVLDGKIKTGNRKIAYHHQDVTMPLHLASSCVSEMASLVLYLQHFVRPGYTLILEEPESHLDPQNQLHLAKCIVNLIRTGVNVLITTHSPYIVEQLGNYMQIGGLGDKRSINVSKDDYVLPDEVAVYDFERGDDGVIIKPVDVSTIDGITQRLFTSAFDKISELAYSVEDAQ